MVMISDRDERTRMQAITPYEDRRDIGGWETFSAGVGLTWDEEVSISSGWNRQGWADRRSRVSDLIDEGFVNREDYQDKRGRFDYERLAKDLDDPTVKSNEVLNQERNALLATRRKYAEEVLERGSGIAQFLGMGSAYMLDPLSIASMPLSAGVGAAKATSVLGRALIVGGTEAGIATATELAIQPLVYSHKQDIESPYTVQDAINNIAMSAGAAFGLGAISGGISGYLRGVVDKGKAARETVLDTNTPAVDQSFNTMERSIETLHSAPKVNRADIEAKLKQQAADDYQAKVDSGEIEVPKKQRTLSKNDLKKTKAELARAKKSAETNKTAKGKAKAAAKAAKLSKKIEADEAKHKANAELDLNNTNRINNEVSSKLDKAVHDAQVESDKVFLQELESQKQVSNVATRTPEMYADPEVAPAPSFAKGGMERNILERNGLTQPYDETMAAFDTLKNPKVADETGELIDATAVQKDLDDQLAGLNEVGVCAIG